MTLVGAGYEFGSLRGPGGFKLPLTAEPVLPLQGKVLNYSWLSTGL